MNPTLPGVSPRLLKQLFLGLVLGASASTLISQEAVTLPVVGSVSGVLVGAVGLAVGGLLYYRLRRSSDCGCSGGCGCS